MRVLADRMYVWFFSIHVDKWVYRVWLFFIALLIVDLILKAIS